jgi:hypothetical protein
MKRDKNYYQKIYDLKSWQGFHVNQLGYIRNLILILSTSASADVHVRDNENS